MNLILEVQCLPEQRQQVEEIMKDYKVTEEWVTLIYEVDPDTAHDLANGPLIGYYTDRRPLDE